MTGSQSLLANYVETSSDDAFRELIGGYLDLVYSAALRLVEGDIHRAEDVTQTVFADLARMAGALSREVMLGGWLHRHTCFVAANLMRGERRRQSRERQAVEMNGLQAQPETDFTLVAPMLDEAINELGEADRTAILLRFFEQRDFRAVGEALGTGEDAARMRVNRALEKLESLLKRRGLTASSAALSIALTANAVQAAPVGLAVTVSTAAALAGATLATTATATVTKAIAMTTLHKTLIAATLAVVTGAGLHQARQTSRLRDQLQTLHAEKAAQAQHQARDHDEAMSLLAALRDENDRLNRNTAELLKLRGEATRLRQEMADLAARQKENPKLQDAVQSPLQRAEPGKPPGQKSKALARAEAIILPEFKVHGVTLKDAFLALSKTGKANDPEQKGINLLLDPATEAQATAQITLELENVTLAAAAERLALGARLFLKAEDYGLIFKPKPDGL